MSLMGFIVNAIGVVTLIIAVCFASLMLAGTIGLFILLFGAFQ